MHIYLKYIIICLIINCYFNHLGEKEVWNLAPFTTKDFAIRSLADRIKDLAQLINLYPETPKAQAFGKYFTSKRKLSIPYST